jgi:hypothetical protein
MRNSPLECFFASELWASPDFQNDRSQEISTHNEQNCLWPEARAYSHSTTHARDVLFEERLSKYYY